MKKSERRGGNMEQEFQQAKGMVVKGFEDLLRFYMPLFDIWEGFAKMGLPSAVQAFLTLSEGSSPSLSEVRVMRMGVESFLDKLRAVASPEEMTKVMSQAKSFFRSTPAGNRDGVRPGGD